MQVNIHFIADDLSGETGNGDPLVGLIDTTLRLQANYYQQEDTIVEQFLEVTLILKSGEALTSPSDISILVRLGDSEGTLAAIDPRRTGSVYPLQAGDHDVSYLSIDPTTGLGGFPIKGRNQQGRPFTIDEDGARK